MKLLFSTFVVLAVTPSATRADLDPWGVGGPNGFPDGVPGSGYGCDRPCGGPDDRDPGTVHYTLRATIKTYDIPNTENNQNFQDQWMGPNDATMLQDMPFALHGRTFVGVPEESSRDFCLDMDGTDGPLGPCFQFHRGDKVKIRVINDMDDGMDRLKQKKVPKEAFVNLATTVGNPDTFLSKPKTTADMTYDYENMPGWEATYDDTNIHFHGLEIVPHLFYPQGTGDSDAEWITIKPKSEATSQDEEDQQCYCYVFSIPDHHPQGTFLHHIHRHGSSSMQMWSGMFGLVLIGDDKDEGSPAKELKDQGVVRSYPLILWEAGILTKTRTAEDSNTWREGNLMPTIYGGTGAFMNGPYEDIYPEITPTKKIWPLFTNNEYQPLFDDVCVNEIIHFRVADGQVSARAILYLVKDPGDDSFGVPDWEPAIPFYVFASDGISMEKPYKKEVLVIAPGQRNEVLMSFNETGSYFLMARIMSSDFGSSPFGACGPSSAGVYVCPQAYIQARINVVNNGCTASPMSVEDLTFTPGRTEPITNEEISTDIDLQFKQTYIRDHAPFLQFLVNGEEYNIDDIGEVMTVGTSSRWALSSTQNSFHPIHIHVNSFQVDSINSSSYAANNAVVMKSSSGTNMTLMEAITEWEFPMWRDTIQVPPFGFTLIRNKFQRFAGKTVFHCHLLSHEDNGMMANMMLRGDEQPTKSSKKIKWAKKKSKNGLKRKGGASYEETND